MKILVWNIQFFTKRRLVDNTGGTSLERAANAERTLANLLYILSTVEQSQADVFVVIEPQTTHGEMRRIATGGGPNGLLYLLGQLREWMGDADWCLVPPQRMNPRDDLSTRTYTECAGVFWRNATMEFRGPWHWTDGGATPTFIGTATAYPSPWDAAVPGGNTFAGQSLFQTSGNTLATFPEDFNRRPFLTHFRERTLPNRTLKLYAIHTSPGSARLGCARMLDVVGMPPGANEITVVTGDFNLDLNSLTILEADTLNQMRNYQRVGAVPTPLLPDQSRQGTRVLPRPEATWADYMTTQALDYAFVGYGIGARQPTDFQATVVVADRVAGTPSPPYNSDMGVKLATYPNLPPEDDNNYSPLTIFRQRWNYGHIAQPRRQNQEDDQPGDGTSDHLPIVVSV